MHGIVYGQGGHLNGGGHGRESPTCGEQRHQLFSLNLSPVNSLADLPALSPYQSLLLNSPDPGITFRSLTVVIYKH